MFDLHAEYAELARSARLDWDALAGKTVLVTGATGLVGGCCIRLLLERNRAFGAHTTVTALVRDRERAAARLSGYTPDDGLRYHVADLADFDAGAFDGPCDYIIHAGCPTASRFFMEHPIETAGTIIDGTRAMLELARRKQCASFVYVSSMEVYGNGNAQAGLSRKLAEADVGYVDPLSLRSCYPEGKRAAEFFTCAYAAQHGVPAKIARLAQTFGPGIPKDDVRVFAQFARCAMESRDIVLRTSGASTRMYNYTTDAVTGLFTVLLRGERGRAYNIANEATYSSVREMAELVARDCAGEKIDVRIETDPDAPYPPEHHLPLDTSAIHALGWKPQMSLAEMYAKLIEYLT